MASKKSKGSDKTNSEFDKEVREMFDSIDINGDNSITVDELYLYMKKINVDLSKQEVKDAVRKLDKNRNGKLEFPEFRKFLKRQSINYEKEKDEKEHILATFRMFDKDGNGVIDKNELRIALRTLLGQKAVSNDELEDMMNEVDSNEDGRIDYDEFVEIWHAVKGHQV